jgi:nucleoside-diphosphate-sugar epimerase
MESLVIEYNNIAIIGANSILAQSICERLTEEYNVFQVYHINHNRIGNKENLIQIKDFLKSDLSFGVIYFISSVISFDEKDEVIKEIFETNVKLLKQVSEKFINSKIIHASTVSVYKQEDEVIVEKSNIAPKSSYAHSKLWAEQIVDNHKGGGVNIRISSLFGSQMNQTTFLPKIISNAIYEKKIIIFGDGSRKQNYISAVEASEYFYKAIYYSEKIPLLAVGKQSLSNIELAQMIQKIIPEVTIAFYGEDSSKSFVYNNIFTKDKLQINKEYSFIQTLNEVIQWIEKQF